MFRWSVIFLAMLSGCDTPVRGSSPERSQPSSERAREPERSRAAAVKPSDGAPGLLKLASGATLSIPSAWAEAPPLTSLPSEVKHVHVYKLADDSRVMVNEMALPAGGCDKALDDELAKMQKAVGDTDPKRLEYRRMRGVEEAKVLGRRALYSDSDHSPGDGSKQTASLATLLTCAGGDYLVIMYAVKKPGLPPDAKKLLFDLAESYSAKR